MRRKYKMASLPINRNAAPMSDLPPLPEFPELTETQKKPQEPIVVGIEDALDVLRRQRDFTRQAISGAEVVVQWLTWVVQGQAVWPYLTKEGVRKLRKATGDEMIRAGDRLLKYGVGAKIQIEKSVGPFAPPYEEPKLDGLTSREKEELLTLLEKAEDLK